MGENPLTPQQMEALLQFAARKLGVSQEKLARSIADGRTDGLGLSPENEKKMQDMLHDRTTAEKLSQSPQVQAFLQQFLNGDGHGHQ